MKRIIALLLACILVLSIAACSEKETPAAPEIEDGNNSAAIDKDPVEEEPDLWTHVFTQYGNAQIKIVGSEFTKSDWDEDVLRIYYDYTNTDDTANGHYPSTALDFLSITQDGNDCETYRFRSGDEMAVPEDTNCENYVQPGCTSRNTILIQCDPNGGPVQVSCYVMVGGWAYNVNDIQPFDFEIDPDNLMGVPEPFVLPAISTPTYTSGMSASGELDYPLDSEVTIDGIELTKDYDDNDVVRVNLTVTNNGEEEMIAGLIASVELYQDGVGLPRASHLDMYDEDVADSDEVYFDYEVQPGETVEASALFYPRTKSPVEAVLENVNSDLRLGACFDLKSLLDAAEAAAAESGASAAAAAEAASAADKAIMTEMVGSWDRTNTWPDHITFEADLTGVHDMTGDLFPFTYIVTDGVLYLTYEDGEEIDYEVSVSGNDMVLTNTFYQEEQIFVRAGAAADEISDDTEESSDAETSDIPEEPEEEDPYAHLAADIIGCWMDVITGENESFTFEEDLTGLYTWMDESYTFTYELTDDTIEVFFEDGDYSSFYVSVEGDTLYLAGWPLERQS